MTITNLSQYLAALNEAEFKFRLKDIPFEFIAKTIDVVELIKRGIIPQELYRVAMEGTMDYSSEQGAEMTLDRAIVDFEQYLDILLTEGLKQPEIVESDPDRELNQVMLSDFTLAMKQEIVDALLTAMRDWKPFLETN